ncbi:hypothetical protein B0H17DRAFT_196463 [Mycena rosella]|uniref:C2H2-type domain-containing protein n=1 Tax=Mycena rosella TaxID=1033263 RepID=A0AAD7CZA3_MYCRO|nr:hypothetical protein B0H17DRAFT_196463 [Mycena rosella]
MKLTRKRTIDEVDKAESEEPQEEPQAAQEPPAAPEPAVPPLNSTQAVFVDASLDPLLPDHRTARSRTNLPIPVPNLIKKSRGRRVPIVAAPGAGAEESSNSKRLHVCKVEGCGKCFHRGEHLKRHIRSIHTHEKPFPCTFPSCHKFFNRHDNLLQHVKVHRNGDADDVDAEGSDDSRAASPVHNRPSHHPNPNHTHTADDGFDAARLAAMSLQQRSTAITYPTLGAPMTYGPTTTMGSYATNMAVSSLRTSSLRTELPDSPDKGDARHREQEGEDEREDERRGDEERYAHAHYEQQQAADYAQQASAQQYHAQPADYAQQQHYPHPPSSATPPASQPSQEPYADADADPLQPDMHVDVDADADAEADADADADAEVDTSMQTDGDAPAEPAPAESALQPSASAPASQQSYYRLRTPPPLAMAQPQPQATISDS